MPPRMSCINAHLAWAVAQEKKSKKHRNKKKKELGDQDARAAPVLPLDVHHARRAVPEHQICIL